MPVRCVAADHSVWPKEAVVCLRCLPCFLLAYIGLNSVVLCCLMTLWTQVVPGEPRKIKQRRIGAVKGGNGSGVVNNGTALAGRRVTETLQLVLADKFGNTVVGAPANNLLLLAEVREAVNSNECQQSLGEIQPMDVSFFFCNDAARAKQVRLLSSVLP
jgi:hypothetical protein